MKLILPPDVEKELFKLPKKDMISIVKKIIEIADDPLSYVDRLQHSPLWKLRVGEYRVLVYIHTGSKEIQLMRVGHRKNVYKR